MYRGVLLDVDGTLVDSNECHARAWADAFVAHGFAIPFAAIRTRIGMGGDLLVTELTGLAADAEEHQAIAATRAMRFRARWLADVRPLDGARDLLDKLRSEGYPYILASSSNGDELEAILDAGGILDLCRDRTSADDVDRAKPHPDIIEVALDRLELAPADAVLIGDTPYDVEAATRAGVAAIAMTTGGFALDSLADAIAIFRGPASLVAGWARSPLAGA
jgi:HAD superfamily hydrolase (TIGR01509 family)